jgi:hypothetical protein
MVLRLPGLESRRSFTRTLARSILPALLFLTACGDDDHETAVVPTDFSTTLERSVCFGVCPVYTVRVDALGLVQYDGTRCVAVYGHQETQVSQQRLHELITAFRDVDFFALQDVYNQTSYAGCAFGGFDGTVISVTFHVNGMTKTVRDYHGCNPADIAAKLDAFERKVDDLLSTAQWVPCGMSGPDDGDYSQCYGNPGCL